MEKFLVTMEYTYRDVPDWSDTTYREKIDTVGVFDSIEEAIEEGNKVLIELEKHFELNPNYNRKYRLSKNNRLISNLPYLVTPFTFFLKLKKLQYNNCKDSIREVLQCVENYKKYKEEEE